MRSLTRLYPRLFVFFLLLTLTGSPALAQSKKAGDFEAGREYETLPAPPVLYGEDDGRVEVLSFFWYNCGTCKLVDPEVSAWAAKLPADVRFVRLPVTFNPTVQLHARIFLTLRALNLGPEADQIVFDLFQVQHKPINHAEQLPELAQALKVDEKLLVKTFNSPQVEAQLAKVEKLVDTYDLPGVPAMVIDGKYRFDIGTAHGPKGYLQLADHLIDQERQARKKAGRSSRTK